ncbi:MAG: D-alanyl-D-alanine carboxypeptidase family protein, partial [Ruminococcus sp.]|nr:D-alanyl-D-alanine carboxypeptidase family protein [Ruminococcus sp.]
MERIKEFFSNINWTNSLCKKLGLGLAAMLLFVVALTTHSGKTSADTSDDSSNSAPDSSQVETDLKYDTSYIKLDNETMTNSGLLALDNKDHKYAADGSDFVFIYQYLFNDKGEQVMSTSSTGVCGTQEMMEHLNKMVSDFAAQTGLKTIMVTNASYQVDGKLYMTQYDVPETTEAAKEPPEENADENGEAAEQKQEKKPQTNAGSTTADGCYEHLSGMAIDFQLYEADKGTYPEYTGEGQYAWINENCWKYGFVLRYPADKQGVTGVAEKKNHYRYVGAVYAQIMHENNLALEELYAFLDK